eukprot:TRINITY_DN102714_c0_g1_i1.p1 TRINITY_DN102714_c0_g1~~TRINITY_DN102714_c0_g1_i1.p1  ORF type:complete len:473 (+),score=88.51 TRINITY_DN102714_c0_g1_i1:80-1498(+)
MSAFSLRLSTAAIVAGAATSIVALRAGTDGARSLEGTAWSRVLLAASFAAANAALLVAALTAPVEQRKPRLVGGNAALMQALFRKIPLLERCPSCPLGLSGFWQVALFAMQIAHQEFRCFKDYKFEVEEIEVELPGDSTPGHRDRVVLRWLQNSPGVELTAASPVVLITPGLSCHTANLPGTAIYKYVSERPWRVCVFEKRGVGPADERGLRAPVFSLFGHPSDLDIALRIISERHPEAPIHLVGYSGGNGLVGSWMMLHGDELPNVKDCLLLLGGEDYNLAFKPPKSTLETYMLYDVGLLPVMKERFVSANEKVLREHNKDAYEAILRTKTLQEFYDLSARHFSGYEDPEEAERRLNPFSGHNRCMLKLKKPFMVIFTEDDPVAPGGPRDEWLEVVSRCDYAAVATFESGSHLACFDSWSGTRWLDDLTIQWLQASMTTDRSDLQNPMHSKIDGADADKELELTAANLLGA